MSVALYICDKCGCVESAPPEEHDCEDAKQRKAKEWADLLNVMGWTPPPRPPETPNQN